MKAPLPLDEARRLEALRGYQILDTDPEPSFDELTLLASQLCGTPFAAITLVDESRQWFKAKVGLTMSEMPRDLAFCAHTILRNELLLVQDVRKDRRFANHPLVTGEPGIRFYAGAPLLTPEGQALGTLCVLDQVPRELSEEQKTGLRILSGQVVAQMELRRNLESLRLLGSAVEQAKESIMITDAELDFPGPRILFVNPAFTQMTGYSAEEVLGKTPRILQGERTDKLVLSRLRRELEQGRVFEGETINYRKDGQEYDLEWHVAPVRNPAGQTTHFVSIQHDITARKRLENQLFQAQKMETVGKLAGGIAHEFNSILTAIIGQSEILLDSLPLGSSLAHSAAEISQAAGRAATLTRQLLAYGRKQFLQPEIIDLNQVMAGLEGALAHLMGGAVVTRLVPAADLQTVKADVGQIEQVIMNLLLNARDAMPNGGKLTLETANVSLNADDVSQFPGTEMKAGEYVMFAITDTGVGMTAEVRARAIEPFFSTKGVGQGTGLGLSTCDGIVKQSRGHLSIYSELGRGTTCKIYLPQAGPAPKPVSPPKASGGLPRGTETILMVEDDPALREMASTLLQRLGYTIVAAANGIEALSVLQQRNGGSVDLLFTDIVMPHLNGRELADRLLAFSPRTRILFTSAYAEQAMIHQGVLSSGTTLLQKPYAPSALAQQIRKVLDEPGVSGFE
jgi:PAS domain S-box-containing protein